MTIVAHAHPFVIGVDTHARNHAVSILACPTGELVDDAQFPTTAAGLSRAVSWAGRRTGGDATVLWVIEGTGTYGARLARAASDGGYAVVEAPRMNARANRRIGKSDPLDARRIAAAALPLHDTQLREPRADDGVRAAISGDNQISLENMAREQPGINRSAAADKTGHCSMSHRRMMWPTKVTSDE